MDSLAQVSGVGKGEVFAPLSFPPHPPITPPSSVNDNNQAKAQAKEQAKEQAKGQTVFKDSKLYRYLVAEARRRVGQKIASRIAAQIVGMNCTDAKVMVEALRVPVPHKHKIRIRRCRKCGKPERNFIEGYCFECYREAET
jgi:hypothetical protein